MFVDSCRKSVCAASQVQLSCKGAMRLTLTSIFSSGHVRDDSVRLHITLLWDDTNSVCYLVLSTVPADCAMVRKGVADFDHLLPVHATCITLSCPSSVEEAWGMATCDSTAYKILYTKRRTGAHEKKSPRTLALLKSDLED